jgi:glutathione S-transferase
LSATWTLYHLPLSPHSRKVRVALKEKGVEFQLVAEKVWERRQEFLALNPAGEVPVLVDPDGHVLCEAQTICEYLDEVHPDRRLIGFDPMGRAETRRLAAWFSGKFNREVSENLLGEKLMKRFMGLGEPDSARIRDGFTALSQHLDYIADLSERRRWLAGDDFSLADIAAAAQLSSLDYIGDVPWEDYAAVKDWYVRVKSRPSFRPILADHIPGLPPPKHYADLDF